MVICPICGSLMYYKYYALPEYDAPTNKFWIHVTKWYYCPYCNYSYGVDLGYRPA